MKNLPILLSFLIIISVAGLAPAQDNFLDRNPLFDYTESTLNSTDTIPDYSNKKNKLKISGTIYESDGVTPAKNVILFIEQPNEDGNFDLRLVNEKRYVHHRAWVKTDANGNYSFYTFIPGNDRIYNQLQQIFPVIKAPNTNVYEMESFLFNNDPLLTKSCRKKLSKKGMSNRILALTKANGIYEAKKDIILKPLANKQSTILAK